MIARLVRWLWVLGVIVAATAAWASIQLIGGRVGPWAAGLTGAMLVAAAHPAVMAIDFVLSRIAGDPVPLPLRLSPWGAIRMYDAELDASMRGLWFATPFRADQPAARPGPGTALRPSPILFIHGYLCNRAVWLSFMRDAAARGYLCEALTLTNPLLAIETHAGAVDRAIDALLRDARAAGSTATRVLIVGHSMGGLVTRAALQRIDPARVAHVITLGTPHRGTFLARFGTASCLVQMRPHSEWLAGLDALERGGNGLRRSCYTTLYSHHDDIVFPQRTGMLDGAYEIAIGGCGHVALLYDRRVRDAVFGRLDALEFGPDDVSEPSGADAGSVLRGVQAAFDNAAS